MININLIKQENRGGKRMNAGRPPQYIEETVPISLRVPKSKEIEIRNKIAEICKSLVR